MDWCIEPDVGGAVALAEAEVLGHLARHADNEELVDLAGSIVHRAMEFASGPARHWLTLDWEDAAARLTLRPLRAGDWPAPGPSGEGLEPLGEGVALAHQAIPELARRVAPGGMTIDLGVLRPPEWSLDPAPGARPPSPRGGELTREEFLATVTGFLGHGGEAGRTQEELAAWAGATLGKAAEDAFRARTGAGGALAVEQAAEAFVDVLRQAGGDFFVVEARDRRVVIGNRGCPFGPAVTGSPALCRTTSAMVGGIAARSYGEARVTLDERLALGDRQCRLVVDLGPTRERPVSHQYRWPPAGWPVLPEAGMEVDGAKDFVVALTLRLPRDQLSVPVGRHLTSHALAEVGVLEAVADDVELALAEACANVVAHSGPGDVYDVTITIGPQTCEIRVTDIGRGFDHASLSREMARADAESGRGVALMHALMDQVRFTSEPEQGTVVHLVKRLEFDDDRPARRLMLAAVAEEEQAGVNRSR